MKSVMKINLQKNVFFYQLDGEGIRFELVAFIKAISDSTMRSYVDEETVIQMSALVEKYYRRENVSFLSPLQDMSED